MKLHRSLSRTLCGCLLAAAGAASAFELTDRIDLHGYGHVLTEREGSPAGSANRTEHDLSLLATLQLQQNASVWMQVAHLSETHRLRMDWLFLDLALSPTRSLHIGQARLPLGLMNEIRDVQALRPSATLPLLYDEDLGLADEALRGVVLELRGGNDSGWTTTTEVFAAATMVPDSDAAARARVVGGRQSWAHDGLGLTLRLSGYVGRARHPHAEEAAAPWETKRTLVLSAQRELGPWTLGIEGGSGQVGENRIATSYLQAARALGDAWSAFARVETVRVQEEDEATRRQRRLALGVAWNAGPHWGLRLEVDRRRGEAIEEADAPAQTAASARWTSWRASVNYRF